MASPAGPWLFFEDPAFEGKSARIDIDAETDDFLGLGSQTSAQDRFMQDC